MKFLFPFLVLFLLFSCKTYSEEDRSTFDQKIKKYLGKNYSKYTKSESGLYYLIQKEGEGANIKPTDEVEFVYEGKLLNGTIFDGEHKRNPVKFRVDQLIQGWQEAMLYLKQGGKVSLVVPPHLGYGDYELDDIPPHSILLFKIEVKAVN